MLHGSYNMGTRGLPDIYTLSPQACGPWASGVYIRKTTCAHGITIKCVCVCLCVCTHICMCIICTCIGIYVHGINSNVKGDETLNEV